MFYELGVQINSALM